MPSTAYHLPKDRKDIELFAPGHKGCAGCGQMIAARVVARVAGKNTIISNGTGCLEVVSTQIPQSSWRMPWIHSLFENPAAIATGILAALRAKGKDKDINIIAQGGDGGTFDIGFGIISGMWERYDNILYVCYDNEGYMNTGYQNSGSTQFGASTSTAPSGTQSFGNIQIKKNLPEIAIAHRLPYVATATVANIIDIENKVKRALSFSGPKYLQIFCPCVPGWKGEPDQTINIAKLAADTGLYPIFEAIDGKKENIYRPPKKVPVIEYLKTQKRFKHLLNEKWKEVVKKIQEIADKNLK